VTDAVLDDARVLAEGLDHPEGVAWDPRAGHLWAGGEGGELYRVSLDGTVEEIASSGGSMLGVAVDGRGRVYACDEGRGEVVRLDPVSGALETYARGPDGEALDEPNVAAFGPDGSLYVTCSGEDRPRIVRVVPGGRVETWTEELRDYPNGLVVVPDASAVLVVEGTGQRVARVPIAGDGSAGRAETFARLPDTDADGLALDALGRVWVTLYRPDGLVCLTPGGEQERRIDDHLARVLDAPTNLAFAGDDLGLAVVANVGDRFLLALDLGVRGQPLFYPEVT
jgi:sugar lactone lactonase YvrE